MSSTEQDSWLAPIIIITVLTIVFSLPYYLSTKYYEKHNSDGRQEFDYAGRPVQPIKMRDQIILTKNEKHVIGRTLSGIQGCGEKKRSLLISICLIWTRNRPMGNVS